MNDMNSLAHTSWNCKYHIVFAPKYRRKVFFGEKREEIGKILRMLCEWKKVEILYQGDMSNPACLVLIKSKENKIYHIDICAPGLFRYELM